MDKGRPTFEAIYMGLARSLSARSTCLRLQVGCVITSVDYRKVLAIGYNGNASGLPNHCDRTGADAVGNCGCLHAEENAVIHCDSPRQLEKLVFTTNLPCVACAKRLINLGNVRAVYFAEDYRIRDGAELLRLAGISVEQFAPEPDSPGSRTTS